MPSEKGKELVEGVGIPQESSKQRAKALLKELELRKKFYRIADFNWNRKEGKYIPQQHELIKEFVERMKVPLPQRRNVYLYKG